MAPLVVDLVATGGVPLLCGTVLGDGPSVFFVVIAGGPAVLVDWDSGGTEVVELVANCFIVVDILSGVGSVFILVTITKAKQQV